MTIHLRNYFIDLWNIAFAFQNKQNSLLLVNGEKHFSFFVSRKDYLQGEWVMKTLV